MADENWQKLREVFDAAVRQKPEERQNYLVQACGEDKLLLAEVKSLLSSFESTESFLETPAAAGGIEGIELFVEKVRKIEKGETLGHYQIIEQIGTGGMGQVYLARDQRLERKVAVKILNEKFAKHESNLKRFISEAKAASALNHPNILTIYEFGQSGDASYIVSEYIKGRTLRETLRGGSLKLSEVLEIAVQIAKALAAAHEAHLVHRDIKPENVMIRPDGFVKVLDFGLAKLVEQKNKSFLGLDNTTAQQTQTGKGVILGTVNYMSPEQAKAEKVDQRTDIFSFGAVLYEMLAGRTPFAGETTSETFANLINVEPKPLSGDLPGELRRIVSKTLRKKKDERYQTMKDVLTDLKDLRENLKADENQARVGNTTEVLHATTARTQFTFSQQIKRHKLFAVLILSVLLMGSAALGYYFLTRKKTAPGGKKSIAVLPLKPIWAATRDEIYEIGIADSLIYRLGTMKGIIVRPLGTTRKYDDVDQDPLVAGKEQQTDYVLAANYQILGSKIRITAQLFNVESGQIEETYKTEKDAGNVFALQDAIAGEIGNLLQERFATTSIGTIAKRGTTNEEAYRLYLQGRNLATFGRQGGYKKAIERYEEAIKLDPNFARAYARMAFAYFAGGIRENSSDNAEKVRELVNKALELDPNLAEAYVSRGYVSGVYDWDPSAAEKDYLRAIELEPNNEAAHWLYALNLSNRGRFDKALAEIETAMTIEPGSTMHMEHRGQILYCARRYDEAIKQWQQVINLDDRPNQPYAGLSRTYEIKGDYASAYQFFLKREERSPRRDRLEIYQKVYETAGWIGVRRELAESLNFDHFDLARLYALQGAKDAAFDSLNKAVEKREWHIVKLNVEPAFDNLRSDPRFDELVRRVGLK